MSIAGSIESVTLNGQTFAVPSDADVSRKLGGFENEIQANGNGTVRQIKTRVPWGFDGLILDIDDLAGDQEFVQALANEPDFFPITVTFVSGAIYQGDGQITGEIQFSNQNSTATVNVMGTGDLTKQ